MERRDFFCDFDVSQWCDFSLPQTLVPVRQRFESRRLEDPAAALLQRLEEAGVEKLLRPGMRVALTAGSRGIANMPLLLRTLAGWLKARQAQPFIVPAMGSHGGATAEGQQALIESYGITQEAIGCPIVSSMETVCLGTNCAGRPVFLDKHAFAADGIIVVNRIKAHTDFNGPVESGLCKMLAIGLGKNRGAREIHALGSENFARMIPSIGQFILDRAPVLFGVGILENAYDETALVEVVRREGFVETEKKLLATAKAWMSSIRIEEFDVLVIEEIGKDISGTGMDPNITGRSLNQEQGFQGPSYQRMALLGLSRHSGGNANGFGAADFVTRALVEGVDYRQVYTNILTSTIVMSGKTPAVMPDERSALCAAIATCNRIDKNKARIVFVRNTLELGKILVTENLVEPYREKGVIERLEPMPGTLFDADGRFLQRPSLLYS